MQKILPILLIAALSLFANKAISQVIDGYHDNLAAYFEEGRYLDCAFKADRMLMKEKYKRDPEVYLYIALCKHQIYLLSIKDPQLLLENKEHKNAYNDALKYGANAVKRDKKIGEFFPRNNELLKEIIYTGLPICEQYIAEERYSKASSYYRKFLKLVTNHHILFMKGVMDLYSQDNFSANEIFVQIFDELKNQTITEDSKTEYLMPQGFILYHDFLIQTDSTYFADSAFHVIRLANRYYRDNPEIKMRMEEHKKALDTIVE